MSHNQLKKVQTSLSKCRRLVDLNFEGNGISELIDFSSFPAIGNLNFNCNKLTTLPESLVECAKLRILYVNDNQITSVPVSVFKDSPINQIQLERNPVAANGLDRLDGYREYSQRRGDNVVKRTEGM